MCTQAAVSDYLSVAREVRTYPSSSEKSQEDATGQQKSIKLNTEYCVPRKKQKCVRQQSKLPNSVRGLPWTNTLFSLGA